MIVYGSEGSDSAYKMADPVSWSVIGSVVLTKLAEGFATKVGERIGSSVADAVLSVIGFGKPSNDTKQFKDMLDQLAERIIQDVRLIVAKDRVREANGRLASQLQSLNDYINARVSNAKLFDDIRHQVRDNFHQLVTLSENEHRSMTLGSLMASGMLLLSVEAEHFRIAHSNQNPDLEGVRANYLGMIDSVMKVIGSTINLVEDDLAGRVIGPDKIRIRISCMDYIDGGGGVLVPRPYVLKVGALRAIIDGKQLVGAEASCGGSSSDARKVQEKCKEARDRIAVQFENGYAKPFREIQKRIYHLLDSVNSFQK